MAIFFRGTGQPSSGRSSPSLLRRIRSDSSLRPCPHDRDVDFIAVVPNLWNTLVEVAGQGSVLHKKHRIYLHPVSVATAPENYEDRLIEMYPGAWHRLRLFALEAHDLALSKLEANRERDRDDVQHLARAGYLDRNVLQARYYDELRPNLPTNEATHDLTLRLWLEAYF